MRTLKEFMAKTQVDEGATPKYSKARPVPYALLESGSEPTDSQRYNRTGTVIQLGSSNRTCSQTRWHYKNMWGLQNNGK